MIFDLYCLAATAVLYGLAELVNFIVEKRRDLEDVRNRQYPERCKTCHLYPESCICTKRYSVPRGFNSPERIRAGAWN